MRVCRFIVPVRRLISLVTALIIALPASDGLAQGRRDAADLRMGIRELEWGDAEGAASTLGDLNRRNPLYYNRELGSAAVWYGRAVEAEGLPDQALAIWAEGWRVLARSGITDVFLGLDLLRATFEYERSPYFEQASNVYLSLIENPSDTSPGGLEAVRHRLLDPLQLVLPPELRSEMAAESESGTTSTIRVNADVRRRIVDWWNSMDPLPATTANERLIEHLRRVEFASRVYPGTGTELLDDRGRIYIRFGEPGRKHSIDAPRSGFLRSDRQTPSGLRVEPKNEVYTLPPNELWVYDSVELTAQYLFVMRLDGAYSLGTTYDLLPIELRTARHSLDQLDVMEHILRDLALQHPETYEHAYTRVSNYRSDLELNAFADYANNMLSLAAGEWPPNTGLRLPMEYSAKSFMQMAVMRNRSDERRLSRERDARVPTSYYDDLGGIDELPVDVRWARFLAPSGETTLRIFWAAGTGAMVSQDAASRRAELLPAHATPDYFVDFTVVRYDDRYQSNVRHVVRTPPDPDSGLEFARIHEYDVDDVREGEKVGLQWELRQRSAMSSDEGAEASLALGVAAGRTESIEPLDGSGRYLEMSDILPTRYSSDVSEDFRPFLAGAITEDVRLGLTFEVYNLRYDADDRTRYRVSYEVMKSGKPVIRTRASDAAEVDRTQTMTYRSGASSTAREIIRLVLRDWPTQGDLEIVVRVRDEVSGQEISRSLSLSLKV